MQGADPGREALKRAFERWVDDGGTLATFAQYLILDINVEFDKLRESVMFGGGFEYPELPPICCGRCGKWVRAHDCLVSFAGKMQSRFGICKMLKKEWPDDMSNWVTPAHGSTACDHFVEPGKG